jgi:excisionase family DNA binding protein
VTISCLPVREPPLEGESLNGYVRRHVQAMGYDRFSQLLTLLDDAEIPADLNIVSSGPVLMGLGRWFRREEQLLRELTVHRWAKQLVVRPRGASTPVQCDSKTLLRYFTSSARICRSCVGQDPNRERLLRSFRPLGVCPDHAEVLRSRCPSCRRVLSPRRLDLVRCRCGYVLTDGPAVAVTDRVVELSRQIVAWLAGVPFSTVALPTAAGFWWLDRLRSAIIRAPTWLAHLRLEWAVPAELGDESLAWLAAADLIEAWPAALEKFLDVYQTVDKHLSTSTGVGRSFGLLLRDADRLERNGHATPAETLRSYLLAKYRRGHLTRKIILFRSPQHRRQLRERPWLTQTEAARRLRVRPPTIAGLIQRGALVGEISSAGRKGRTVGVVSVESVDRLRGRLAETLSVAAAAERLGVERHRVLDLIRAKILGEAVRTARGWRLTRASVDELLQTTHRLPIVSPKSSSLISLREATRRFGGGDLNLVRIVELIRAEKLPARRDPHDSSLCGLRFDLEDLRRIAAGIRESAAAESGHTLNQLAGILIPGRPLKEIVLRKWIAAGLLKAVRHRHRWQVFTSEVERFRTTYSLAPEACALLTITRSTLARFEAERRIVAIYGRRTHSGAGASVFLRADAERFARERAA